MLERLRQARQRIIRADRMMWPGLVGEWVDMDYWPFERTFAWAEWNAAVKEFWDAQR